MVRASRLSGAVAALTVLVCTAEPAAATSLAQAASATDPVATAALDRMSAYLASLQAFEVTSNATQDLVLEDGHVVKLGLYTRYVARPPEGLYAEVHTDRQHRNFYFDGSTLTMTAPRMGFYARAAASGSIRNLVDVLRDDYGVELPLADLFLWNARDVDVQPTLAVRIGYADVGGQEADQYLFVGPEAEWQIWIKRGDQPLPLRMVVTDTTRPARPQFAADLTWNLAPEITADQFTFRPPQGASQIVFGALSAQENDQ